MRYPAILPPVLIRNLQIRKVKLATYIQHDIFDEPFVIIAIYYCTIADADESSAKVEGAPVAEDAW